ncbi:MAG: DUF3018 family protein [Magnetovibrio sp.]|nr:DUF3018 family protein [Magnetovibrio sp.]
MARRSSAKRANRDKVRRHRERMRARGLRPVQVWVPDTRSEAFAAAAARQALAVARSPHAFADQAFIDAVSEPVADTASDEAE